MRQRKLHILLPATLLLIVFILSLNACDKKKQEQTPTQSPLNFDQAERIHRERPQAPARKLPPVLEGVEAQGNQKCRQLCKNLCLKGRHCNVPGFRNARRCARLCLTACNRDLIPETTRNCVKPNTQCKEVTSCLRDLRDHLREARKKQQEQNAEQATPEPQSPTE